MTEQAIRETVVWEHEGSPWFVTVSFGEKSEGMTEFAIEPVHVGLPCSVAAFERLLRDLPLHDLVALAERSRAQRPRLVLRLAIAAAVAGMCRANIIEPADPELYKRVVKAYMEAEEGEASREAAEKLNLLRYVAVRPGDPPGPRHAVRPWSPQLDKVPRGYAEDAENRFGAPPVSTGFIDECAIVLEAIQQLGRGVPENLAFARYLESRLGRAPSESSAKRLKREARPIRSKIRASSSWRAE